MTKKTTKRALLMSALAMLMCVSMLVGSTFAWFTDSVTSSGNKIQAGTLKLDLELLNVENGEYESIKESQAPIFNYDKWEPGYIDAKVLKVENEGTLALKWYAKFTSKEDLSILANVIDVYVCPSADQLAMPGRDLAGYTKVGTVAEFVDTIETTTKGDLMPMGQAGAVAYLGIALKMREEAGNEYQGLNLGGAFDIQILATQLTYESDSIDDQYDVDAAYPWNGESDTEWYNTSANEYVLDTAEELAGFAELVNSGKSFSGKTVKLAADVNMAGNTWTPVGITSNKGFSGTFDGQGHTISNFKLTTSSGNYGAGFFGNLLGGCVVKNVNFDSVSYTTRSNVVGVVAGYLYGSGTFENIQVTNANVKSFGKVGGILGMAADPGAHTITMTNCSVEGVIGGGYNVGGLIGLVLQGQTVNLTNCNTNVAFEMNDGGYGFTYVQTEAGWMWNYYNQPVYAGVAEQYCYYDAAENEFCMGIPANVNFS